MQTELLSRDHRQYKLARTQLIWRCVNAELTMAERSQSHNLPNTLRFKITLRMTAFEGRLLKHIKSD